MDLSSAYSVLSNIYANYSKKSGYFYVYSYRPDYDISTKNTLKKDVTSIGKICTVDGIGTIEFNAKFLKEHPDLLEDGMNMRAVYIRKLFNNIGGYRSLVYMDKDFFKKELEKRIDIISKKFTREEIQTNKELFNS